MDSQNNTAQENWFEQWFNSPYYHILYQNRDYKEAELFISNLMAYLNPSKDSLLLDAACGKGRHAVFMADLGFEVDGFDLSPNSIIEAKKNESDRLHFYINDIRNPLKVNHYSIVFNLFTSFGYFNTAKENQEALIALAGNLKSGGVLVLDFMNCAKVMNSLPSTEDKEVESIVFNLKKEIIGENIVKTIRFTDKNKEYSYEEKVRIISKERFESFFKVAGLTIEATFGDYELSTFDLEKSDRLIFIARKVD